MNAKKAKALRKAVFKESDFHAPAEYAHIPCRNERVQRIAVGMRGVYRVLKSNIRAERREL